jgi:integrase
VAAIGGRVRRSGGLAARAGVRRDFAPHQLRHAHAIELAHEGVPRNVIQRRLGHRSLGVTSIIYRRGSTRTRSSRRSRPPTAGDPRERRLTPPLGC